MLLDSDFNSWQKGRSNWQNSAARDAARLRCGAQVGGGCKDQPGRPQDIGQADAAYVDIENAGYIKRHGSHDRIEYDVDGLRSHPVENEYNLLLPASCIASDDETLRKCTGSDGNDLDDKFGSHWSDRSIPTSIQSELLFVVELKL